MNARLIALITGVLVAAPAGAYEPDTHRLISSHAALRTVLYQAGSPMSDWGYGSPQSEQFGSNDFPPTSIEQMVANGAEHEDNLAAIMRVFNHFYDPQFNAYAGRGMQFVGVNGHPSPTWALEEGADQVSIGVPLISAGGVSQEYSLRDASRHFLLGLTSQTAATRRTEMGRVFQTLGHVVHHLQDMAQPQHVRNEVHMPWMYPPLFDPGRPWYEIYTSRFKNAEIPAILANNAYPGGIPTFSIAREFWSQAPIPGPRFRGMADFSAQNYVGMRTNFRGTVSANGAITISGAPGFALPSGANRDGTPMTFEPRARDIRLLNGALVTRTMRYVIGNVFDEYSGQTHAGKMLASESVLDPHLTQRRWPMKMTHTSAVFDDNYSVLLPRASAFSTGLINHFFRGRIGLSRTTVSGTDWTIANLSTQILDGEFYIYREESGVRTLQGGPWVRTVGVGGSAIVSLTEPPSSTTNLVAVFRGKAGIEGSVASGFYAVAGKVIPYSAVPALPCSGSISYYGSTTAWEESINLGSQSGPVQVELEAYDVPDRLDIKRNNAFGATLWTTGGLVRGFRQETFQHTGSQDTAQNRINIKLTPNPNTYTVWVATVGCPNEVLDNADRAKQRIKVSFDVVKPTGFCNQGEIRYFLDGAHVGTLFLPGGGSTHPGIDATLGPTHKVSATISIPNPVHGCGGLLKMRYFDREGPHEFSSGGAVVEFK